MDDREDSARLVGEDADVGGETTPRRRARRVWVIVAGGLGVILIVAVVAFVVWAQSAYRAEASSWAAVRADERITVATDGDLVIMTPRGASDGTGLVFFAGARVDPDAYAATFTEVVAAGTSVVIVRPPLNLAILETRSFDEFTADVPDVDRWAVGGHSMGGVRACGYAQDPEVTALVLLASYCSDDVSDRADLAVLTVAGSRDALATPEKIEAAEGLLPADATFARIDGASHAQFGAYGPQDGDGIPTLSDERARELISETLVDFLAGR